MKNKFLIPILLLGLLTLYFACQKDDTINKEEQSTQYAIPNIETISYDDAKNTVFNDLKARYNLDNHKATIFSENIQGRTTTDTLGLIIETDIIKQVTLGDYTSYTMKIVDNDSLVFYNLTIEYKDGSSDMFITKYTPTEYWLNNKGEVFQGKVQSKKAELTQYTDPEEAFDELGGGLGNPDDYGGGGGGGGGSAQYGADYPWDCMGIVIVTTDTVPYPCTCNPEHMPWQTECGCPNQPGWEQVTNYHCNENWDFDPLDPSEISNPGGGAPDPTIVDDGPSVAATIKPEECTVRIPGDEDGDCDVDYIDCQLGGNEPMVCDCVSTGNSIDECSTILDCIDSEYDSFFLQLEREDKTKIFEFIDNNGCNEENSELLNSLLFVLSLNTELSIEEAFLQIDIVFINEGNATEVDPAEELSCFDLNQSARLTVYVQQPRENSDQLVGPNEVGHAFIGIEQGNIVRQIGYYPDQEVGAMGVGDDYNATIKTNYDYLYHVSISKEITSAELASIVNYSVNFPPVYNTNNFACTDFAINIGNLGGMNLPSTTVNSFTFSGRSPGVLGQEIRAMESTSTTTISTTRSNSPERQGECN